MKNVLWLFNSATTQGKKCRESCNWRWIFPLFFLQIFHRILKEIRKEVQQYISVSPIRTQSSSISILKRLNCLANTKKNFTFVISLFNVCFARFNRFAISKLFLPNKKKIQKQERKKESKQLDCNYLFAPFH